MKRSLVTKRINVVHFIKEDGTVPECTCFKCPDVDKCPLAFDPYNLDGDCLMNK